MSSTVFPENMLPLITSIQPRCLPVCMGYSGNILFVIAITFLFIHLSQQIYLIFSCVFMKNKEEIIQEIQKLAKKISEANSEDTLLESTRELYEKSILLKHIDDSSQASPKIESPKEEKIIIEEKPAPLKKETLSKEPAIDLFSSESASSGVSSEPTAEKVVAKEPKTPKKKSEEESVGEKLLHKKITDLKASIGINEKFQF